METSYSKVNEFIKMIIKNSIDPDFIGGENFKDFISSKTKIK